MEVAIAVQHQHLQSQGTDLLTKATALTVATADDYSRAGEFIGGCKSLITEIKSEFAAPKKKADEAHKSIVAWEKRLLQPVEKAISIASAVALTWKQAEDRKAREAHDREEAAKAKAREEQLLRDAEYLQDFGDAKAAEEALKMATIPMRPTKFESPAPKVAGISTRKKWKARVVDPDKVSRPYCDPSEVRINARVASLVAYNKNPSPEQLKTWQDEIGGVEIYEEEIFAGRR